MQVLLFGVLAIEIKRKAPAAHTICEIIRARWGTAAHIVFLCFCFLTNIIVTAMLLLGGSAVVNALTGMSIYAASFLIPLGVVVYTLHGGLKATFLASYLHSVVGKRPPPNPQKSILHISFRILPISEPPDLPSYNTFFLKRYFEAFGTPCSTFFLKW